MRLHTDSEIQHMSRSALTAILEIANAVYFDQIQNYEQYNLNEQEQLEFGMIMLPYLGKVMY